MYYIFIGKTYQQMIINNQGGVECRTTSTVRLFIKEKH